MNKIMKIGVAALAVSAFSAVFANEVEGKNQEYWVDQNGVEYYQTGFTITWSHIFFTPKTWL